MGALSKCVFLLLAVLAVVLALATFGCFDSLLTPSKPKLPASEYWGRGDPASGASDKVESMKISVDKHTLDEIKTKLKSMKYVEPLEGAQFEYGFNGDFMRELVRYWLNKYNWKTWEHKLNEFRHYRTQIEGLSVHFIRAQPAATAKRTVPLLIMHGWPGSVLEFYKLIPLLTAPDSDGLAFEVVAPSIPGYAWSEAPKKRGFTAAACARIFHKLMQRLGHSRYYIQGGDWGALIANIMVHHFQESILGHHTNMPVMPSAVPSVFLQTVIGAYVPGVFSAKDSEKIFPYFEKLGHILRETGYFHIQATRPDTVGHALQDSPVGWAAYMIEKFCVWTMPTDRHLPNCNLVGPDAHFSLDELITNAMIYWTTGTVTSSMRFYKENIDTFNEMGAYQSLPSTVPHGVASFKFELSRTPERFVRTVNPNLLHFGDYESGGHFAAFQLPAVMNKDIRTFVQLAHKFNADKAKSTKKEL